jgi:hypothetical protein
VYSIVAPPALPLRSSCGNSTGGAAVTALGPNLHRVELRRSTEGRKSCVGLKDNGLAWPFFFSVRKRPLMSCASMLSLKRSHQSH